MSNLRNKDGSNKLRIAVQEKLIGRRIGMAS